MLSPGLEVLKNSHRIKHNSQLSDCEYILSRQGLQRHEVSEDIQHDIEKREWTLEWGSGFQFSAVSPPPEGGTGTFPPVSMETEEMV